MTHLRKSNSKKGMTLIELVAAMLIFAIITGVIFSFLQFGSRIFKRSDQQSSIQFDVRMASDYLVSELRNAKAVSFEPVYDESVDQALLAESFHAVRAVDFDVSSLGGNYVLTVHIQGADDQGRLPFELETKILLQNIDSYVETGQGLALFYQSQSD